MRPVASGELSRLRTAFSHTTGTASGIGALITAKRPDRATGAVTQPAANQEVRLVWLSEQPGNEDQPVDVPTGRVKIVGDTTLDLVPGDTFPLGGRTFKVQLGVEPDTGGLIVKTAVATVQR